MIREGQMVASIRQGRTVRSGKIDHEDLYLDGAESARVFAENARIGAIEGIDA